MTARFLLDTNIVSAPLYRVPNPTLVARLEKHADQCAVPAPVWHELNYGYRRLPRGKRRRALETYLHEVVRAAFPVLPYDGAAAAWHAAERVRLERAGLVAPFVDGQIAAIARLADLTLVTRNAKDFRHFKELKIVDWA